MFSGLAGSRPINRAMDYRHDCSFCGWGRSSDTPVMLSPCCDRCGCALDAVRVSAASIAPAEALSLSRPTVLAMRWAGVLSALLGFYAATKLGYELADASGAMIAFGLIGFVLLPFVPEQV